MRGRARHLAGIASILLCSCGGGSSGGGGPTARCGDGIVQAGEACDDGGTAPGDGCSASCTVEAGFTCAGSPSACTPGGCGDGVRTGSEQCDDGNTANLDGCDATCRFEQVLRARTLVVGWQPTASCPANAFGSAVVYSAARSALQAGIDSRLASGDLSLMLWLRGLDDLAGGADADVQAAFLSGLVHPDYLASFDPASELDGWFTASGASLDAARLPVRALDGSFAGGTFAGGPGRALVPLTAGGPVTAVDLVDARLGFTAGAAAAVTISGSGSPPGHLASEQLAPGTQSFASAASGELCGGLVASSLAQVSAPSGLALCGLSQQHSVLELLVAGCPPHSVAVQPDAVDPAAAPVGAGGPYVIELDGSKHVSGCRDAAGVSVSLAACLDAAAYSSVFALTFDRVVVKPGCGDGSVAPGEACDDGNRSSGDGCSASCAVEDGWTCAGAPSTCAAALCGDGIRAGAEECDDGNLVNDDGCHVDCKLAACGDGILDASRGEQCDDGNAVPGDGCQPTCLLPACGDGFLDPGEQCDDGNPFDGDGCSAVCLVESGWTCAAAAELTTCATICGDGLVRGLEACDDGNLVTETACPYGAATCTACSADCSSALVLTGLYCGDAVVNGPEACDDGNAVTETACPYGTPTCTACSGDCLAVLSLAGPYCGDGIPNGPEACDDGNTDACGTCSATCSAYQHALATGTITAIHGSFLADGEWFEIWDGVRAPVRFEFDAGGGVSTFSVRVPFTPGSSPLEVAASIAQAVNATNLAGALGVVAYAGGTPTVLLQHQEYTSFGNRDVLENVVDPGFIVTGLAGGAGGDCPYQAGCASDADCAPGLGCPGGTCI